MPLRKRKRSEPDPAVAKAITAALTAGNGRVGLVKDRGELMARLREDSVQFKVSDVLTVWGKMLADGVIEHHPRHGYFLSSGVPTRTGSDWTRVADIERFFSLSGLLSRCSHGLLSTWPQPYLLWLCQVRNR